MIWTSETPTQEGFYWHRKTSADEPQLARLWFSEDWHRLNEFGPRRYYRALVCDLTAWDDNAPVECVEGEWSGPIEPPTE